MLLHFYLRKDVNVIKKIIIVVLLISVLASLLIIPSYAGTPSTTRDITTTTVAEDLATMSPEGMTFEKSDTKNIFLGMSQHATEVEGEFFAITYVYLNWIDPIAPGDLYINLSCSVPDENGDIIEAYKEYSLQPCGDPDGTWYKFEVVSPINRYHTTRRFRIDKIYDKTTGIELKVNQTRIFTGTTNDTIKVFAQEYNIITIESKDVKFVTYGEEKWFKGLWNDEAYLKMDTQYEDAWFVFFNTNQDYNIEKIENIDIEFRRYDYRFVSSSKDVTMDQVYTASQIQTRLNELWAAGYSSGDYYIDLKEKETVTISIGSTTVTYGNDGWKEKKKQKVQLDNIIDLKEYATTTNADGDPFKLRDMASFYNHAVMFAVTEKWAENHKEGTLVEATGMQDVAILRIEYLDKSGERINAYAVDTPTDDFSGVAAVVGGLNDLLENFKSAFEDIGGRLKEVLPIILVVLLVGFLFPILVPIFNAIIRILTMPFKLISRRRRKRK